MSKSFPATLTLALALGCLQVRASAEQIGTGRTLLVSVVDSAGRPDVDLGVDDFVVTEGGDEREILDVHVADYPVVLLVDDGAEPAAGTAIKGAVSRFLKRIGERPAAIGILSNPSQMIASFDDDRSVLLDRAGTIPLQSSSAIVTLPVVANAARMLRETGSPFSAIVVIATRLVDATAPVQGNLLPSILESGAAVHVVVQRPVREQPDAPDLLRVLADQTRGQYTTIYSPASFTIALERLADRFAVEMMIDYLVPEGGRAGDVRVGVRKPGARVSGLGVSK